MKHSSPRRPRQLATSELAAVVGGYSKPTNLIQMATRDGITANGGTRSTNHPSVVADGDYLTDNHGADRPGNHPAL